MLSTLVLLALAAAPARASTPAGGIVRLDPPESGFYAKELDYRGIPIKASVAVADAALIEAFARLHLMLRAMPVAADNLRESGAQLHLIGKDQVTSDLPEYRSLKGKPFDGAMDVDARTRGLGGSSASCGEENLLRLGGDRYPDADVCVHEFAHTLHHYGLSDGLKARLKARYEAATAAGLWKTAYAGSNVDEFFAELSMWYFGTRGSYGEISPRPAPGAAWLKSYDPESYALIDGIYSGALPVARRFPVRLVELEKLPPGREGSLKSSSGPETTVAFDNRTSRPLRLYWLDFDGKRKPYGDLPPKSRSPHDTFATHVWLVAGDDDRAVLISVAATEPGVVTVRESDLPR